MCFWVKKEKTQQETALLFFLSACPKPAGCIVGTHSSRVQEPHGSRAKRRGLMGMVVG